MDSNNKIPTESVDEPARKRIRPGMYVSIKDWIRFHFLLLKMGDYLCFNSEFL